MDASFWTGMVDYTNGKSAKEVAMHRCHWDAIKIYNDPRIILLLEQNHIFIKVYGYLILDYVCFNYFFLLYYHFSNFFLAEMME